ncbi:MAG: cell division protein FtsQ/DivIB [Psychromonas sp.]|nr:cell division protein FtsQ/DivIB [Psychromonas sp.]
MLNKLTKKLKVGRFVSILFFVCLMSGLFYSLYFIKHWITDDKTLPITYVSLTEQQKYISVESVKKILRSQGTKLNFFNVNIAEIQKKIEALPWVYSASIRKHWPDTLDLHIVEQSISAVWNNKALLNRFGEVIHVSPKGFEKNFVVLKGEDKDANQTLDIYNKLFQLMKVSKFKIAMLSNDERHSTNIMLKNGILLRLGKEQKLDRVQRFLSVFPLIEIKYNIQRIDYIDLRYDTGFAIGWKNQQISKH